MPQCLICNAPVRGKKSCLCLRHECDNLRAREDVLTVLLLEVTASLAAAISLLERGSKNAAPSDKMFDQMLMDYKKSLNHARSILKP